MPIRVSSCVAAISSAPRWAARPCRVCSILNTTHRQSDLCKNQYDTSRALKRQRAERRHVACVRADAVASERG